MVKRLDTMGFESEHGVYVRAADYDALAADLAEERTHSEDLRTRWTDLEGHAAALQAAVEAHAARAIELEAALRDLFEFHVSNDTKEGHNMRCNRWKGLGCTCGGTRVVDRAKLALAGSPS